MYFIRFLLLLLIFCIPTLGMDAQIQQLIAQRVELQKQIADKQEQLARAQQQNKKTTLQLQGLGEKIFIIYATKKIDNLAAQAYFQLLPPTENPSPEQQFADNSFFLFKSVIINEVTFQLLYNHLKNSQHAQRTVARHAKLITYLAKETPSKWPTSKPNLITPEILTFFNTEPDTNWSIRLIAGSMGAFLLPLGAIVDGEEMVIHYTKPLLTFYWKTLKNYYSGTSYDTK